MAAYVHTDCDRPSCDYDTALPWVPVRHSRSAFPDLSIKLPSSIYRLSKSKIIYGIIILISFPGCVLGIITGVRAIIIEVYVHTVCLISNCPCLTHVVSPDSLTSQCWTISSLVGSLSRLHGMLPSQVRNGRKIAIFALLTLVLVAVLTWLLWRSRTGFRRTDTVLYRLIRGAIQTGLFAGIFSIADLATFLTLPETNLYGMFAIPIGRIYTNVSSL